MSAIPTPPPVPKKRTPSSWTRREADGWFTFYPGETVRCPAVDRRYDGRPSDRRRDPRPCDRSWITLSLGTMARTREVPPGSPNVHAPAGHYICMKCGKLIEVQLIPISAELVPLPPPSIFTIPPGILPPWAKDDEAELERAREALLYHQETRCEPPDAPPPPAGRFRPAHLLDPPPDGDWMR